MRKLVNNYETHTLIALSVIFYNVQMNIPADPTTVSLWVEDPTGVVTQVSSLNIVRTGVGTYYANFMPTSPGLWKYKWEGSGTSVQATSPDTAFFVRSSDFLAELV
jgi:hypothetical protein